jgi:hypothetical protein
MDIEKVKRTKNIKIDDTDETRPYSMNISQQRETIELIDDQMINSYFTKGDILRSTETNNRIFVNMSLTGDYIDEVVYDHDDETYQQENVPSGENCKHLFRKFFI